MAGKVKTICEQNIVPIIEKMGYDVIEVEYSKQADGMNLVFYIDKEGGVNIDDCEKVSRAIDPVLDELNPTDDKPYTLSVSSPGLDRPLKTDRDLSRNVGKEIEISLFSKLDGKKSYTGTLQQFDKESITLAQGEKVITIKRSQIGNILPSIKF